MTIKLWHWVGSSLFYSFQSVSKNNRNPSTVIMKFVGTKSFPKLNDLSHATSLLTLYFFRIKGDYDNYVSEEGTIINYITNYLLVKFEANAQYISVEISFCKGIPEYFLIIISYSDVNN